jgi:hypothetical protein
MLQLSAHATTYPSQRDNVAEMPEQQAKRRSGRQGEAAPRMARSRGKSPSVGRSK